jgi:hypothetical protein
MSVAVARLIARRPEPSEERHEQVHHMTDPYQRTPMMARLIAKYQAADKPERLNIMRAALDVAAPVVEKVMALFPPISSLDMRIECEMIATRFGVVVAFHRGDEACPRLHLGRGETARELHRALEDVIEDCREAQRQASLTPPRSQILRTNIDYEAVKTLR